MDRGIGGSLEAASAYLMKRPSQTNEDRKARTATRKIHRKINIRNIWHLRLVLLVIY